jgi:hypothetical protein
MQASGNPTASRTQPDITAAVRHPHNPIIHPTNGTIGPEIPGPMRKMPKARLLLSRKTLAIRTLIGML